MAYSGFANLTTTDTIATWFYRTNQILDFLSNQIVTTDSSNTGAITDGNTYINGIFSANVISVTEGLRGGTVDVSNTLYVTSNLSLSNTDLFIPDGTAYLSNTVVDGELTATDGTLNITSNLDVSANVSVQLISANNARMAGNSASITTASSTIVDEFPSSESKAFKYIVGVTTGSAADSYIVEVLCTHDGNTVYYTRYGEILLGTANVEITADYNNANVALSATCGEASGGNTHTVKVMRLEVV